MHVYNSYDIAWHTQKTSIFSETNKPTSKGK